MILAQNTMLKRLKIQGAVMIEAQGAKPYATADLAG